MEERRTVREWAKEAGLKLYNYDGFVDIYSKLSGNSSNDFHTQVVSRFRDAGELVCTRKAFETLAYGCTMEFPNVSQYEKMSDVIPGFVEQQINSQISRIIGNLIYNGNDKEKVKANLEELLDLMKQKVSIREKSIKADGTDKQVDISELDENNFSPNMLKIIKKHNGTVEDLEVKLSDEIIQTVEKSVNKKKPNLSTGLVDKLRTLTAILHYTERQSITNEQLEQEFMYVSINGQNKEPFAKTYSVFGKEGIETGVVIDEEGENGSFKGVLKTTPEINARIDQMVNSNGTNLDLLEKTDKAMQIIDGEVTPEERKSLMTRIKEFANKILNKIIGKNEGR